MICTYQDLWSAEGGDLDGGEAGSAGGPLGGVDAVDEGLHVMVAVRLTLHN